MVTVHFPTQSPHSAESLTPFILDLSCGSQALASRMLSLSPEKYLNQVVPVYSDSTEYKPLPNALSAIVPEEVLDPRRFKIRSWFSTYLEGPADGFVRCLRTRRFWPIDIDDRENDVTRFTSLFHSGSVSSV